MVIKSKIFGNVLICYVKGELDHHTACEFRNYIDSIIDNNNIKNLVIDMSKLEFLDSSGIGALIGRYKNINGLGGKVAIVDENKQASKMLEV